MARAQLGRWPSGYELARVLNELKHDTGEFRFIAEVSKFVAEGARDNFMVAMRKWSAGEAHRPGFHTRRATGSGSFLAASGVDRVSYDDNRDRRIGRDEVIEGVSDYFEGFIGREDVLRLIQLYFSGDG